MKNYLIPFLIIVAFVVGCAQAPINFNQALLYPEDQQSAENSPTPEDLNPPKNYIAFTAVRVHSQLTRYHQALTLGFIQASIETYTTLGIVPEYQIENILSSDTYRSQKPEIADVSVEMGAMLQAKYVALVNILPNLVELEEGNWGTYVNLEIYQVSPKRLAFKDTFSYTMSQSKQAWLELKPKIQQAFPLRGFVLETRNHRAYAKVSLGKNNGIKKGRKLSIFKRVLEQKTLSDGSTQFNESYSSLPLAKIEIMEVEDETAWGLVPPDRQNNYVKGDAVFADPEL
ncbi:MAG: hypothetical protein HQM12_20005 [SAR324 cluster bacterium]|nr:hypothetical protein [SAR324 cluster bacterium]